MKKLLMLIPVVTIAIAIAFMITPNAAKADSSNAAVVINGESCKLIGGSSADGLHVVITSNGNRTAKCKAQVAPPASGHAEHYDTNNNPIAVGLPCNAGGVLTDDWSQTTSASGEATITCKVH